jgi:hypothetical protein
MRSVQIRSILPALILSLALPFAAHAQVGIGVSINVAPPEIPVYEQPAIPEEGYMWTPGFWQWGPDGYFWVPGTWVQPPSVGLLWTPGYWGWGEGAYLFHSGYWGEHVGFYGGVNYGYGYGGAGFEGGYWRGGHIFYNRSVMNVGEVHVTNVYNKTVIVNNTTRVSFNGGNGGVSARPTQTELAVAHERHIEPTPMQTEHVHVASSNRALLASVNHGAPAIAATAKPGVFAGRGVVSASHAAPVAIHAETHAPTETHAPVTGAAAMTHGPIHPAGVPAGAPRPDVKAMSAHPETVAPPHPAAIAPPHAPVQHAAPPPPPPPVQHAAPPPPPPAQHAAPPPPKGAPPKTEEKRN